MAPTDFRTADDLVALERYRDAGGEGREVAREGVGHGIPLAVPGRLAAEIAAGLVR